MDCTDWLEHVPNICLPSPNHPIFNIEELPYLDIDNCMNVFQRLQTTSQGQAPVFSSILPQTPAPGLLDRIISPTGVMYITSPAQPSKKDSPTQVSKKTSSRELLTLDVNDETVVGI